MFIPPGLSEDGFELHFAINHLAHAMIIQQLLPIMTKTAEMPNSDVRLVSLTSTGWMAHPSHGVTFSTLRTPQEGFMGSSYRYGYVTFGSSSPTSKITGNIVAEC